MRRILAICSIGVFAIAGASTAIAADFTLTESKAERMLVRQGTVHLAPADRASLERELRQGVARFRALEVAATDAGNVEAWWTYNYAASRYFLALEKVRGGLDIKAAQCAGIGRSVERGHFKRFDCMVTSEIFRIPTTELGASGDDGLPTVVEREPRDIGPLLTQVRVRVTGKSKIAYS
jgi:hypothetical protein